MNVTVIVYRGSGYTSWRADLVALLTKKYRDWGDAWTDEPNFEFASDERMDHFWRVLDAERLSERFTLTIDVGGSTTDLLSLAKEKAQAPIEDGFSHGVLCGYSLYHLESGALIQFESGTMIEDDRRLEDYAIEDGDHFGLIIEYRSLFRRLIRSLPDSEAVFAAIRSADAEPPTSDLPVVRRPPASGRRGLRGALLYTDEDPEIATYVRKHFASLSEASGPNLLFYVIEQPESGSREASRYWKGVIDEQMQREWVTLGWLRTKPYRPEQAYEVARRLGVYPDELPCLVLFERVSGADKLVFPLLTEVRPSSVNSLGCFSA